MDWLINRDAATRWLTTGSPYESLGMNWNPNTQFPYIYPPSSWPLLLLALALPAPLLLAAYVPLLVQRPRLAFAPLALAFLVFSFGPAFYWGNVNILVAALGVTFLFQGVSVHYLLTFAAAALIEPPLWGRRVGHPQAPSIRAPRTRVSQLGP